jgi:hypothetical protein
MGVKQPPALAPAAASTPKTNPPCYLLTQTTTRRSPPSPLSPNRRQGLAKKVERSRKQLKERKNRTKKIRGIKKNKSA